MKALTTTFPALALLAATVVPALAAQVGDPAREAYRGDLVACISRSPSCDRDRLSREDQDYLAYEMRDQRFDSRTVTQVADVRMAIYGRGVAVVQGKATGTRYPAPRPAEGREATGEGGGGNASQIIGLTRSLADVAGPLIRQMGTGASGVN